jgi:hypothetical protein
VKRSATNRPIDRRIIIYTIFLAGVIGVSILGWHYQNQHQASPLTGGRTYHLGEPAATGKTVLKLTGTNEATSQIFTVKADWSLYWDFICYNEALDQNTFRIDVQTINSVPTSLVPIVHDRLLSGYGTQPYAQAGSYRVAITSSCKWHIIVKS